MSKYRKALLPRIAIPLWHMPIWVLFVLLAVADIPAFAEDALQLSGFGSVVLRTLIHPFIQNFNLLLGEPALDAKRHTYRRVGVPADQHIQSAGQA